jgi:deoxyhypusine synthase
MDTSSSTVRQGFVELSPLDLWQCHTVGELVHHMSFCSFGARMLGEVAATWCKWFSEGLDPIIIWDDYADNDQSFNFLRKRKSFFRTTDLGLPTLLRREDQPAIILGRFSEAFERTLATARSPLIFINQFGLVRPGQVQDGYFPNVVFSDPRFILPILYRTVLERCWNDPYTVTKLMQDLPTYGGLAAQVAHGAQTLKAMIEDRDCKVFLTLSGAMTVAKMGLLVCEMIERGMVQYIASTGALMAHNLVEGMGLKHYKYNPAHSDQLLADEKINRVTDTLEPEENFDAVDKVVNLVLDSYTGHEPISPIRFHRDIGRYLSEHYPQERGILKAAYERSVPVAVPAFGDSEIGNDVFVHNQKREREKRPRIVMDMEQDTEELLHMATKAKRTGIFSIGGGVPRNNTQNVAPLIEIYNDRLGANLPGGQFHYGCRIDPTPLYYGNLSGCTYSEGGSWRKFDLVNGHFSEIQADATIVWPFILKYVLESL